MTETPPPLAKEAAAGLARCAANALRQELATFPKPGLVSHLDSGSHPDMDAACFTASIRAIEPFFARMAEAGAAGCGLGTLQEIGIAAEEAMLAATAGRNTHRGAIFCLGLFVAAAGLREHLPAFPIPSLGDVIRQTWGSSLVLPGDLPVEFSNGVALCHRHGLSGVRGEAREGFPSVYETGLPTFQIHQAELDRERACVQTFFALLEVCEDTTLLKRGGLEGYHWARETARRFLAAGGVRQPDWRDHAVEIHRAFIDRHLTAGGAADLLAATLFVAAIPPQP